MTDCYRSFAVLTGRDASLIVVGAGLIGTETAATLASDAQA